MIKYFTPLLLLATHAYADNSLPQNTVLPNSGVLVSRFDSLGIIQKSKWHEGKVVNGIPVLTIRDEGDLYIMNNKTLSSMSITAGVNPHQEANHAASLCFNIAYVATNAKDAGIKKTVTDIIEEAATDESGSSGDLVGGYWFTVDIKQIDKYPMLVCEVSGFTRWD